MTPRARLLAAVRHETPDRVPISTYELVGWNNESWENQQASYKPLMEYIREKTDCLYMTGVPTINRYVRDHTTVKSEKRGTSTYIRTILDTPKGELSKLDRADHGLNTVWHIEHLIKDDEDLEKYLSIPDELLPVNTDLLKKQELILGDKGILLVDIADPLCIAAELFEFGDYTVKAYTDKLGFTKILDKLFESQMYFLEDMLKKGAGPLFRIVGPEYATPPYLGKELFHEYVYKYDKRMIRLIHDYGKYARIHCHGRIKGILKDIVDMEADALDPVEAPPSGDIEIKEIKKLYGNKLCLMGNIQLRDLEFASPEQMKDIVKKAVEEGKQEGSFVIMPTASPINAELSERTLRNYKIFIDTAIEYGKY
jgi:uroporphyrinogen-III decarboxylase